MSELPNQEKSPEAEKKFFTKNLLRKNIESFLSKSDEPGPVLSDQEEFDLSKRSGHDPEALKQWKKHKLETKYRRNSLSIPLMSAELFLNSDESVNIPKEIKDELLKRVKVVEDHITKVGGAPFIKSDIQEVVDLLNDLKKYL